MADRRFTGALRHVHGLAARPPGDATDGDLLRRFVADQNWAAFAAIVRRHGPLVLRVCRRVLGHEQDAEDAFQATFLVLARKASAVRDPGALVSWLHGAAYRMAKDMKRAAGRRRAHEARARVPAAPDPAWEAAWREAQAVLDEEVGRLPERLRGPFLLCCQEGHGQAEAARQLGVPEGTVWSRLSQARERLRTRLARRGIALPAVLTAAALAPDAAAALPGGMTAAATRAARAFAVGGGAGVSAQVIELANRGVRAMAMSKVRYGAIVMLAAGAACGLAGGAAVRRLAPVADLPAQPQAAQPPAAPADRRDDQLPAGARLRLGSARMRHGNGLRAVAFLPGGWLLATAGDDDTIRIWNPDDGTEIRRIAGQAANIAVSPDGSVLAAALGRSVKLWDTRTGREMRTIEGGPDFHTPAPLAFAPDGTTLAVVGDGGAVRVIAVATGEERLRLPSQADPVRCLAFTADGLRFVAVTAKETGGGTLRVWDLPAGTLAREVILKAEPDARLRPLALSPDGKTLAVEHTAQAREANPGGGRTVFTLYRLSMWDVMTGTVRLTTEGEKDVLWAAAFTADGSRVATSGMAQHVSVWDAATGKLVRKLDGQPKGSRPDAINTVAFSPDGNRLAVVGDAPTVLVWDLTTGKEVSPQAEAHQAEVSAVAYAPDGRTVATASGDHTVRLWDATTGRPTHVLRGHTDAVRALVYSPDGRTLASADMGSVVCLWDAATGQLRHTIQAVPRTAGVYHGVCPIIFTGLGTGLIYWGDDRRLRLFDVATGKEVVSRPADLSGLPPAPEGRPQDFNTAVEGVTDVRFSPDCKTAAVALVDSIRLVDVATGKERLKIADRRGRRLAFSPDGRTLAGGDDKSVVVWDATTGKEVMRADGLGTIQAVAYSADGQKLAAATTSGGLIHVLDARTGQAITQFRTGLPSAITLAFSPDGRDLASGMRDTTILVWAVPPAAVPVIPPTK
jgi:RNA polymerase sigma factor (sigma-70 family)